VVVGYSSIPMSSQLSMVAPSGAWLWLRAIAFSVVSVGIGVVGHATAMGHSPNLGVMIPGVVACAVYGRLVLGGERVPAPLIAVGIAAIQVVTHFACRLMQPSSTMSLTDDPMAGMAGMAVHSPSGIAHPVAMVAFHVVATVVGLLVLTRFEACMWTRVRTTVRAAAAESVRVFRRWLTPLGDLSTNILGCGPERSSATSSDCLPMASRWLVRSSGRRGPPDLHTIRI
jgi:hypothetical protein